MEYRHKSFPTPKVQGLSICGKSHADCFSMWMALSTPSFFPRVPWTHSATSKP